jgi:hypothetical protein
MGRPGFPAEAALRRAGCSALFDARSVSVIWKISFGGPLADTRTSDPGVLVRLDQRRCTSIMGLHAYRNRFRAVGSRGSKFPSQCSQEPETIGRPSVTWNTALHLAHVLRPPRRLTIS